MNINGKEWLKDVHRIRESKDTRFDKLRLDKNEWISEFPDQILEIIKNKFKVEHLIAYPETQSLYTKIAEHHNIKFKNIIITTGIDGGIKNCFDLFITSQSKVVTIEPTFAMVEIYCQLYNCQQIKIKYDENLKLDTEELLNELNEDIDLLIIANPNSPTGTIISQELLQTILSRAKKCSIPVLVDEAYYGFYQKSVIDLVGKFPNLIVARTFSKAFGMAGCRMGYLVTNPKLSQELLRFRPMYEVNSFGILVAETMLENYHFVLNYCNKVNKTKKNLFKIAKEYKIPTFKTYTNFMHFDFGKNKQNIIENFKKDKILISGGLRVEGYDNYTRISIGTMNSAQKIIQQMKMICKEKIFKNEI